MPTMTIHLPKALMARVASAAERAGKTPHSFILEAVAEKVEMEECCAGFTAIADARFARILRYGKTIPWSEMRRSLDGLCVGSASPRSAATKRGK